jgi:phospho-N-acetylmuramoyl-pentapeptide-transferase
VGSLIGFLWYNSYQHRFCGDTGSLTIGGIIAVLAIAVEKKWFLYCAFLVENLSVVLQVSYFKYTKKRFGEGRRIFLMSPLHHHHYQKKGYHVKLLPFWIVACHFINCYFKIKIT